MDYKNKYLKYKERYLKLKNMLDKKNKFKQLGGFEPIEHSDNSFLNGYKQIVQYGQNNCGIFESKDKTKIIKCEKYQPSPIIISTVKSIKEEYPEFKIFPEIYNIHRFEGKIYIEMEKFDGDLTQLLYEILPKYILENMVKEDKITQDKINKYYELFQMMITKTNNELPQIYCDNPIILYLIKNISFLPEVMCIAKENWKTYVKNNYRDVEYKKFNGLEVGKNVSDIENQIKTYKKLERFFSDDIIKHELYFEFIEEYKKQFGQIFESCKKQVLRLELLLLKFGLTYTDMTLDNYAYRLSETNISHLDKMWNSNSIFGDKYLFVSILDWDGLENWGNERAVISLANNFRFGKYGHSDFRSICTNCPILIGCDNSELGLNEDGYKILTSNYSLEDSKYDFKSIEEVEAYINEDN